MAHANAAAFGNGATTTRANQQVFGTTSNTYTMSGIHSQESKDAQSGKAYLVTSDAEGNLATANFSPDDIKHDIRVLEDRDKDLASGIAIAMSLDQPQFQPGQTLAMRVGWGNFDGSSAIGVTAAGIVARGFLWPTSSLIVDAGVGSGVETSMVAGRAGMSLGW